jgi:hypothetical protein
LESHNKTFREFFAIWKAKTAKSRALRELIAAQVADGTLTATRSPIATAAAAAVQDLLGLSAAPFLATLSEFDEAAAPEEFRLILQGTGGVKDGATQGEASVLVFRAYASEFVARVGKVAEQCLAPAALSTPSISTPEAVRQIMEIGLQVSQISGAFLAADADPAWVASLTNIGAIDTIQKSEAFKALTLPQQQLALRAALAIAQAMPAEDSLSGAAAAPALALSASIARDVSGNVSLRQARTATTGLVDARAFNMNGTSGQSIELGLPLFVQLKGDVSSAKSTDAATGSVAYRLGNTVIGAIQGYANSGAGFGTDSRQLETSVVASHSFGSFFVEGQIGSVSANDVHISDWSGVRSQVTLGLDTEFVSPFVQLTHRQLDRSGLDLNETTAHVGLDMDIAKLAADTYSVDTRLLAKLATVQRTGQMDQKILAQPQDSADLLNGQPH